MSTEMDTRSDFHRRVNHGMEYFDHNEVLHEIGLIQDQGYVIAVRYDGHPSHATIAAVSENLSTAPWLDVTNVAELLNKNILDIFEPVIANMLLSLIRCFQAISRGGDVSVAARNYQLLRMMNKFNKTDGASMADESVLCCSVVASSTQYLYILELEDVSQDLMSSFSTHPNSRILQSGDIISRIRACETVEAVTATFLDSVMEVMSGYDRGMVYRFGDDNSGHVIHERIRDPNVVQSSYLGLRFPADDIPPQARILFMKNGVRFIHNVFAEDSRIISSVNSRLDLSLSCLRASSKCHLKYLINMGIVGSMSIAIVVDGALWGLYVLHSYTKPAKPTVEERIVFEMVGSITSMRIQSFLREQNDARKLELGKIFLSLPTMKSVHEFLMINAKALLSVIDAHAIIIFYDQEQRVIYGDESIMPSQVGLEKLRAAAKPNTLLHINNFTEGLTGLGGGAVFYTHQYVTLAFIRRSRVSDVKWGGRPDVPRDPNIPERLCPRASFEIYMERARTECRSWTTMDLELIQFFVDRIIQYLHSELLASFRLSLEQSNSECIKAMDSAKEHYEFFAHMSHELRTPFHGVMSSLQILDTGGDNVSAEERKEIIESALECGKTMLRTLDDILTIAKSRNNVDVVRSPVVIGKVFASTRRMMSPIAEHKLIAFTAIVAEVKVGSTVMTASDFNSMVVLSDETRLGQISNNLTNNAIKFTPSGGKVTITARILTLVTEVLQVWSTLSSSYASSFMSRLPKDESINKNMSLADKEDQVWFVFSVHDTGCGVKKEDMEKMFDAYKQLSSGVSKTYQGTGLGLHICRLHIELMGGILGIASTYGQGTMFLYAVPTTLYRPRSRVPSNENLAGDGNAKSLTEVTTTEMVEDVNLKNSIFMVVDDSNVNLRLTKRKIQLVLGEDVQIQTAGDGVEGIEAFQALIESGKQPMLRGIFMDYHMPRCSGIEAMIAIRKIETERNLQPCYIVAFTADLSETSSRELLNAGANEVLPKPTPAGQLESVCSRLIRYRPMSPSVKPMEVC